MHGLGHAGLWSQCSRVFVPVAAATRGFKASQTKVGKVLAAECSARRVVCVCVLPETMDPIREGVIEPGPSVPVPLSSSIGLSSALSAALSSSLPRSDDKR